MAIDLWTATIPLAPPDKGNSHRIRVRGGRPQIITEPGAVEFKKLAIMFLRSKKQPDPPINIQEKLSLYAHVRFKDYTRDGSIELVADVLQQAGIVPDDVQFRTKHFEVMDEVGEPETTINIFRVGELPWKRKPKKSSR